ncbi:hypothetical protein LMG27952_03117 [Paraburkholderia hiiakae]|uniref:Uncharacterized protein n=1 Tax=Paraburkholderia hiiakae TaxID=1081782 RepID=A0ABN7HU80_9BURK|nr:hypothetical protein [Paraburkholderia hiiakae]CAD6536194.1 hypothetical protein LMG27952_03117 [Paraburkholderia hiiakae]
MTNDPTDIQSVFEMRRRALADLVDAHSQAEVARRTKKADRQISDMVAGRKAFGEKVALEMELAWSQSGSQGDRIDLLAPRRLVTVKMPEGWGKLDEIQRAKAEAFIGGLLAQADAFAAPAFRPELPNLPHKG